MHGLTKLLKNDLEEKGVKNICDECLDKFTDKHPLDAMGYMYDWGKIEFFCHIEKSHRMSFGKHMIEYCFVVEARRRSNRQPGMWRPYLHVDGRHIEPNHTDEEALAIKTGTDFIDLSGGEWLKNLSNKE
jgi:hypothetical protein